MIVIRKFLMEFKRPDKVDGIMFCGESFWCQAFDVPVDGSSASIRYHRYRNISLHGRRRRLLAQRFCLQRRKGASFLLHKLTCTQLCLSGERLTVSSSAGSRG